MWVSTSKIETALERIVKSALEQASHAVTLAADRNKLKEEIESLKIEKGRREEEFARRDREIEHKIGLERKRQEFEISQSKREASVGIREENLKADRARFEEQMKFHDDRFSKEVSYLKDMLSEMMKRLPSAEIIADVSKPSARR